MKIIILSWSIVKKNILPIMITMIIMTVTLFIMVTLYGQYKYNTYQRDLYANTNLKNDVFFMMPQIGNREIDSEKSRQIIEKLSSFNAFSNIISYKSTTDVVNGTPMNIFFYDSLIRENFKLRVTQGRWLGESPTHTEAVIGGSIWGNVKIGDTIIFKNGITADVVGIIENKVIFPAFGTGSTNAYASDLFAINDSLVFITEETLDELLPNLTDIHSPVNFFVIINQNASADERLEVIKFLESNGMVWTYNEILSNSDEIIKEWINSAFPLPVFMILIATINIICICAVIVKRSMIDNSKYYLMGCSKFKGIILIVLPMTVLFSIPCILNIISILYFPDLIRMARGYYVDYLLDAWCVIPVIIYLLFIVSLLIIIPIALYRNHSPLTFYRRNL